ANNFLPLKSENRGTYTVQKIPIVTDNDGVASLERLLQAHCRFPIESLSGSMQFFYACENVLRPNCCPQFFE
ncbi:MAG: hypothetical protein VXU50_00995, partial [Verrucomicrobiota bacterium]|nr:hypothetical protein [Verrucomicrobiota bacterium]